MRRPGNKKLYFDDKGLGVEASAIQTEAEMCTCMLPHP